MRFVFAVLTIPAVLQLFIPFSFDVSPFDALFIKPQLFLMALPFFIVVPVFLMNLQLLIKNDIKRMERIVFYILGMTGGILAVVSSVWVIFQNPEWKEHMNVFFLCWAAVIAVAALEIFLIRKGISPVVNAQIVLLAGYIPNALFCIAGFFGDL